MIRYYDYSNITIAYATIVSSISSRVPCYHSFSLILNSFPRLLLEAREKERDKS